MPLTDKRCRNAIPGDKPYRLSDQRGLYLEVAPSGGKWWRYKYRFAGREKRLSLGVYLAAQSKKVEVSLESARSAREAAREQLRNGIDPSEARKSGRASETALAQKAENRFEVIARDWCEKQAETWSAKHSKDVLSSFERDVLPYIGKRPIKGIEAPEIVGLLRRIEARGVREGTHRTLQRIREVFVFAIASGICEKNPAAEMSSVLVKKPKPENFAAITDPKRFGDLLRTLDGYQGTFAVKCALRLAPLLAVRPGELRTAKWGDFDLENAEWRFTISKTGTPQIVPLSTQAIAILRDLHGLTGEGQYLFPSARSLTRPMSDNAVLAALRRMGIPADEVSGHGFRASFRTIAHEVLKLPVEHLELQLGHKVRDALGTAYNRTSFLRERHKTMQKWADFCDRLKTGAGADVLEMKRA